MISARARMLLRRNSCDYGYLRCGYVWRATDDCARMVDHLSSYCARYRTPPEFGDHCVALTSDMRQLVRPMFEPHIVMLSHLSSTRNDAWLVCGRCRARRCARHGVQNRPGVAGWPRPERARQRWGMAGLSHRRGLKSRACDFARWRLNKMYGEVASRAHVAQLGQPACTIAQRRDVMAAQGHWPSRRSPLRFGLLCAHVRYPATAKNTRSSCLGVQVAAIVHTATYTALSCFGIATGGKRHDARRCSHVGGAMHGQPRLDRSANCRELWRAVCAGLLNPSSVGPLSL